MVASSMQRALTLPGEAVKFFSQEAGHIMSLIDHNMSVGEEVDKTPSS